MSKKKISRKKAMTNSGMDWHAEFMQRIKHLRETRFGAGRGGKSKAARAIGVTPSDWSGYEKGVMPGGDKLYRMCQAFGCDANWLLDVEVEHEQKLSETQEKTINTLIEVQQAIHTFDGVFTEALLGLRDILGDPESTQAQSMKLYDIARRLKRLRRECARKSGGTASRDSEDKVGKKVAERKTQRLRK